MNNAVESIVKALFVCWLSTAATCTSEAFQTDADVYRLQHLQYYVALIEEYRAKSGRVPLEGTHRSTKW